MRGSFAPLQHPLYRHVWTAALFSYIGTWMHNVGAAWLMATLTNSPTWIAMVQTASTLPMLLLTIPGGILSDRFPLPRYIGTLKLLMGAIATLLGILAALGLVTPWTILLLTFLFGMGSALLRPAWLSAIPLLVPKQDVPGALTLNSMSFNSARIVGPLIGGFALERFGAAPLFLFNGVSSLGLVVVFFSWQRRYAAPARDGRLTARRVLVEYRTILQVVRFRALLWRATIAFFGAAVLWTFLPLVTQVNLGGGAGTFGTLISILGLGAIVGGFGLMSFQSHLSIDHILSLATGLFACLLIALATCQSIAILAGWLLLGGFAWITLVSTFNRAALEIVPEGERSKAVSLYLVAFSGGQAVGSFFWGAIACAIGFQTALLVATAFVIVSLPAPLVWPLDKHEAP